METTEETQENAKKRKYGILLIFFVVFVAWFAISQWKESPIEKTVPGEAIIHLHQTQPAVIDGQQFLIATITFMRVNSQKTTTETVLIPEKQFNTKLLKKYVFKDMQDRDTIYVSNVDLEYYKDGTKQLDIAETVE